MGMAASQARYLALVARKSNCEYEGQQINQSRTVLSNQSANLFNQMLGLSVPIPPSTADFTKQQFSFSDGINKMVIDSWQQLAKPNDKYNYVVTHHYYADVYTGSQKIMNDPQIQFSNGTDADISKIEAAIKKLTKDKQEYEDAKIETAKVEEQAANLSNYKDSSLYAGVSDCVYDTENNKYTVTLMETKPVTFKAKDQKEYPTYIDKDGNTYFKNNDGKYISADEKETPFTGEIETLTAVTTTQEVVPKSEFISYKNIPEDKQSEIKTFIDDLVDLGALPSDVQKDYSSIYYDTATGAIALSKDLKALRSSTGNGKNTILNTLTTKNTKEEKTSLEKLDDMQAELQRCQMEEFEALTKYQTAEAEYEALSRPTYIGNSELQLLTELDSSQKAELDQIVKDMEALGIDSSIANCFDDSGNYLGGIYQFKINGITYYSTYDDIQESYNSGTGPNNIDGQSPMAYYNASYISTRIEKTENALLETDSSGRFTSVRFGDDTITYPLNAETITDDVAYKDAMNKYNYENAKYDKMVQDINAKTAIIQQEDQQLELRLKQLDTEQHALTTEMEAVQKIVKENVEKSFKTFGG